MAVHCHIFSCSIRISNHNKLLSLISEFRPLTNYTFKGYIEKDANAKQHFLMFTEFREEINVFPKIFVNYSCTVDKALLYL